MLYSPDIRVDCFISGDMGDAGFERLSVPGAELLRAQKPGEYTAQIYNDTFYLIYITAE